MLPPRLLQQLAKRGSKRAIQRVGCGDQAEKGSRQKQQGQTCFTVGHPFRRLRLIHLMVLFAEDSPSALIPEPSI
jgi:hypothetical protein